MLDSIALHNFKLPLYEQVRLHIQKRLSHDKWDINQPIPTEQELSQDYNVSIGTIRKAIERLVEEGLLIKIQGKGTFIRKPSFSASPMRFFRYRNAEGASVEPIGQVKKIAQIAGNATLNTILQIPTQERLIYLERIRLVDNIIMVSEKIWLPMSLFSSLLEIPIQKFENLLYPFYYKQCNQFIASATENLSFIQHYQDPYLNNAIHEPLLKVCRIAKNIEHMPIEYRESWGRAIDFNYEVHII